MITVAKYEFLLLDADGTLFDFLRCERAALRDALRLQGIDPTEEMIALAQEHGMVLLKTRKRMYEACGKLYAAGLGAKGVTV